MELETDTKVCLIAEFRVSVEEIEGLQKTNEPFEEC